MFVNNLTRPDFWQCIVVPIATLWVSLLFEYNKFLFRLGYVRSAGSLAE